METKRESVARFGRCECGDPCFDRGNGHADLCEDCAHAVLVEQDDRIRELEGALRSITDHAAISNLADYQTYEAHYRRIDSARRVLAEGSVKP